MKKRLTFSAMITSYASTQYLVIPSSKSRLLCNCITSRHPDTLRKHCCLKLIILLVYLSIVKNFYTMPDDRTTFISSPHPYNIDPSQNHCTTVVQVSHRYNTNLSLDLRIIDVPSSNRYNAGSPLQCCLNAQSIIHSQKLMEKIHFFQKSSVNCSEMKKNSFLYIKELKNSICDLHIPNEENKDGYGFFKYFL